MAVHAITGKKLVIFLLLVMLLFSPRVVADAAAEEGVTYIENDYEFTVLEDRTASITWYAGNADTLILPDHLQGYQVSTISDWAFTECSSLKSLTIPDSITSLGYNPFGGCEELIEIRVSLNHPVFEVIDGDRKSVV